VIASGLTVTGGGRLGKAAAVRSNDFKKMWFVAAVIEGPSMDGDVGVWATNDLGGGGMVFSASGFAKEFSDWGPGPGFSVSDDGASEAMTCVA
jgi:hypothetical protein